MRIMSKYASMGVSSSDMFVGFKLRIAHCLLCILLYHHCSSFQ